MNPRKIVKVLFICSGNRLNGISPIVKAQGESLEKNGVHVGYFQIKGRGLWGYVRSIPAIRQAWKDMEWDHVHAHYYLSGIVAAFAGARPLIVSLMGSEARTSPMIRKLIRYFSSRVWDRTILKSARMADELRIRNAIILPNGVNFNLFRPTDRQKAKIKVGFDDKKHILFLADPERYEKNYPLAEKAFRMLNIDENRLHVIHGVEYNRIPDYLNASDVLLLTSFWEGSPNVIKEAMSCGLPIVATDVGDISEIIGKTRGCYISDFSPEEIARNLEKALEFRGRTNGRDAIRHLSEDHIAEKLLLVYKEILDA